MASNNRICKVCGKNYYYCPTCGTRKPNWYMTFDSEECKKMFDMAVDYNLGNIDAKTASDIIKECALEVVSNEGVQKVVDEVTANFESKKIKKFNDIVSEI